jgi:hypothetical protein
MNTGRIVKAKNQYDFVQISNDIAQTKNLTLLEKGFLTYLLSLPDDWACYRKKLYEELPDKPGTIDSVWKSLQDKGFIVSVREINSVGHFTGWKHIIYNNPADFDFNRSRDLPKSVFTEVGETAPIQRNNSIQINNYTNKQEVIEILEFEDDESNEAWKQWIDYRKSMRKPVRGQTKDRQLRLLRSLTGQERVATINQSITQGWTGLFEVKSYKKQQKNEYSTDLLAAITKIGS